MSKEEERELRKCARCGKMETDILHMIRQSEQSNLMYHLNRCWDGSRYIPITYPDLWDMEGDYD